MMCRKEDEGQINGGHADLHQDGICEIANGGFRIGLARNCARESKRGRSGRACGMTRHSMNVPLSVTETLDPWVHPFRAVLCQFLIVAPHIGMVVVELSQEIVQFCGILCL